MNEIFYYFELGLQHHRAGKIDEAERVYRAVLERDPRHAPALHHLGIIAYQDGEYDAAVKLIQKALRVQPDYAEAHSNLGLALIALKRPEEASKHFRRAIALTPDYAQAHFNLGVAQDLQEKFEEAIESYTAALKLDPDYADAECNRAIASHALERFPDAIEGYTRALELAPHLTRLHIYLGSALSACGAYRDAVASFRKGIAEAPDDPAAHFCLAEVYTVTREFETSNEHLRNAIIAMVAGGALKLPNVEPPRRHRSIGQFPEALRAAMRCLEAAGIETFLTAGTLLGAIREGDFLPFDKDIDLGVSSRVPMADIARAMAADPDFDTDWKPGDDGILYCWRWKKRLAIDFFRFYEEGDTVWYGLHRSGELMKWVHKPFELVDLDWLGIKVRIPADSEFFLEEVYGPDWRIPDPDCAQWACPNIEGGLPPICRNSAHADIFLALWYGYKKRAHHQCRQALELDPDDLFFRQLLHEFETSEEEDGTPPVRTAAENAIIERLSSVYAEESA